MLNTKEYPARPTLNRFTPPDGGRVGGSPSLGSLNGSAAQPGSSQRTALDIVTRRGQQSTPSIAEAHDNTHEFDQSIESRSHPLPRQHKSLKRQRSPSPASSSIPVLPVHPLSEPTFQSGESRELIDRTKKYARLEPRFALQDERSEGANNMVALKHSEATHVPIRPATGATSAPRQQNTLEVQLHRRGETTYQPASFPGDFQQGAYVQQDRPEDRLPEYPQQSSLAHTHDSANSSRDSTQATFGHWHNTYTLPPINFLPPINLLPPTNTLPPMRTLSESRQYYSTPTGYDPWRWQQQYHHARNHDITHEHSCFNRYGTYEPHIMESRRFIYEWNGEGTLVHETSPMGPPLKPFDPPIIESIALRQQLYVLRKQEADAYPVADTYQVPLVTKDSNTLI